MPGGASSASGTPPIPNPVTITILNHDYDQVLIDNTARSAVGLKLKRQRDGFEKSYILLLPREMTISFRSARFRWIKVGISYFLVAEYHLLTLIWEINPSESAQARNFEWVEAAVSFDRATIFALGCEYVSCWTDSERSLTVQHLGTKETLQFPFADDCSVSRITISDASPGRPSVR